jgi:hypothetical protein
VLQRAPSFSMPPTPSTLLASLTGSTNPRRHRRPSFPTHSGRKLGGLWAHCVQDAPPPQMHDACLKSASDGHRNRRRLPSALCFPSALVGRRARLCIRLNPASRRSYPIGSASAFPIPNPVVASSSAGGEGAMPKWRRSIGGSAEWRAGLLLLTSTPAASSASMAHRRRARADDAVGIGLLAALEEDDTMSG